MLLHNISVDTGLVNGRIGIVEGFSNGCVNVNFGEINSQVPLIKERIIDDLSVSYIPLRPCYAITIHKSQGCTFDSAIVEFDGLFENGQAYVALSRVRNLDNL